MGNKEKQVPPYCNTGAQNTETEMRCLIDWCSFTFKRAASPDRIFFLPEEYETKADGGTPIPGHEEPKRKAQKFTIFDLLGIPREQFALQERGMHGYKRMLTCGNITVLYDGALNMGVHVQMSGQGCREYETLHMVDTRMEWPEFLGMILQYGGQLTRLDLAIDDFRGEIAVADLIQKSKDGECRSKFKSAKYMEKIKLADGSSGGLTIYFGSSTSRIKVRIYEKLLQMEGQEKEVEEGVTAWNRTEVECRDERAQEVAAKIAAGMRDVGKVARSILSQYVNFVERDFTDSNKGRWPVCSWWTEFLEEADKLKLTTEKPERSIKTVKAWVERQVEPSLALLFLAENGSLERIAEIINNGLDRLTEKDLQIIETYKKGIEQEAKQEKEMRFLAEANEEMQIRKGQKKNRHQEVTA